MAVSVMEQTGHNAKTSISVTEQVKTTFRRPLSVMEQTGHNAKTSISVTEQVKMTS
jgi:hypothetical protein